MAELSSQSTSIQTLYAMFSDKKIYVNRRYQRKLVWTLLEKQRLIESILKDYPIPAVLLAEREDTPGTYEIIDGLQRLHSIVSFIETAFSTIDEKKFDISHFPTAKRMADDGHFVTEEPKHKLSQREVSDLLNYNLAVSFLRGATEQEINDVFDRINTYGHRLSDQERRQAGVQNSFSNMVRDIACTFRGDDTKKIVELRRMPSISIDLPMSKHGYDVRADHVFWVEHGILRSTDLRDSMDEQSIADIAACIISGSLIERSKEALDRLYTNGDLEEIRMSDALTVYGADRFSEEFKYCIDQIKITCNDGSETKLRELIFKKSQTNAFPSVFAAIYIAFHELIIDGKMVISDYSTLKSNMKYIADRVVTGRKATSPEERRRNINTIKGIISSCFVKAERSPPIYTSQSTTDIDSSIRQSCVELADFELKQGFFPLKEHRSKDENILQKIINTICAIANNGPDSHGQIIIGVADKESDAERAEEIDGIIPRKVGNRSVIGVQREAKALGISIEDYVQILRNSIRNSKLTETIKNSVLSSIDYNSYYGLGVITIKVRGQKEMCFVGDCVYWREMDATALADTPQKIVSIAKRF